MNTENAIIKAKEFLGEKYFANLNISYKENQTGNELVITKSANNVVISYGKLVELFFGLTLVKQNYKKENFEIKLESRFAHNGLMHDCSRNGVLNINTAKEMILVHALYGLNRFMLYTEDTYEIEGEPYFGYFRGRYTKEEIKDLVEYAEAFGVEIVPCIQTLSHLNQAFVWTGVYQNVMSSNQTFKIGEPKTYELIEKMIKTVSENFKSEYIHIGMDEAIDIGLWDFMFRGQTVDKKKLMLEHLNKVVEICRKYNKKPMMWEDMFFKIDKNATPDWYDFPCKLSDEVKKEIPSDVELIYWDYYHDDVETYDKMMKFSKDTGNKVMFGSGFIRWIGFFPNFNCSIRKCTAGLKAAVKNKIDDILCTTWGDAGGENSVVSSYAFLALHCMYDYYGKSSDKKMSKLIKTVTGLSLEEWYKLQLPNEITGEELLPFENPSKSFLYNDPLLGMFDTRAFLKYENIYKEHAQELKKLCKKSNRFAYIFETARDMCDTLSIKTCIGVKLRAAYKAQDKDALAKELKTLKLVLKKVEKFAATYKYQWLKENKAFGFEVTDGRLGFLIQRIKTAIATVSDYLAGKIPEISEFSQDPLPYNGAKDDEPHCYNTWGQIVTANII